MTNGFVWKVLYKMVPYVEVLSTGVRDFSDQFEILTEVTLAVGADTLECERYYPARRESGRRGGSEGGDGCR